MGAGLSGMIGSGEVSQYMKQACFDKSRHLLLMGMVKNPSSSRRISGRRAPGVTGLFSSSLEATFFDLSNMVTRESLD